MTFGLPLSVRTLLILVAMTLFLGAMTGLQLNARSSGTEVLLAARPIDPRDLFRGYYVRIGLDISELDAAELDGADDFAPGDRIFVTIEADADGVWLPVSLARNRPAEGVAVQGRVTSVREAGEWDREEDRFGPFISARYNLESYFADEAEAKRLETKLREGAFRVIAAVGPDGSAVIKGVEVDGEKVYDRLF